MGHLAARLPEGEPAIAALARVNVPDLFLAYACAVGDAAALQHFAARYLGEVDAARSRFGYLADSIEDLRQRVWEKLFVAPPGGHPKIADYGGQGALRSWVRVTVLRLLINVSTRESRAEPSDDGVLEAVADPARDAEGAYALAVYREQFREAFGAAMAALSDRDLTLLRYAYADGLSSQQVGAIFGIHKATAARWVAASRERLVAAVRAELARRLHVTSGELSSVIRAALSQIDSSVARHFHRS